MLLNPLIALLLPFTSAAPTPAPLPVLLWHGLGDRFDNAGLTDVAALLQQVHPGTDARIISLGPTGADDQRASFIGNVTAQSDAVCAELSADPTLVNTRLDALGCSQGGLFIRGLIERCPALKFRSLVTFGSPHNGIAQLPACGTWDLVCKGAEGAFRSSKWSNWVQGNVVPAQYYREVDDNGLGSEAYLNHSGWLAEVNNERAEKNKAYKKRLAKLDNFAMYMFEEDTTVVPRETSWFAEVNATTGEVTDLQDRPMYKEDWLGLKELDKRGALKFRLVEKAKHMRFTEKLLRKAFEDFFGPDRKAKSTLSSVWSSIWNLGGQAPLYLGRDW